MTTVRSLSTPGTDVKAEVQDCLRAVLDTAQDGMLLIDTSGTVVAVNRALCRLSGLADKDMLGKPFEILPLFPLNTLADLEARLKGTMTGLELPPFEAEVSTVSGGRIKVQIRLTPWRTASKVAGAVAVLRTLDDIRGLLSAHPCRSTEDRFRDLVETTSDIIWEVDGRAVYTYISPQVYDTLGYRPEEVLGKTPFDFVPLQEARRLTRLLLGAMNAGQALESIEAQSLHKNGQTVFLEISGVPFRDASGNVAGYRGIHRDVTRRRAADQQVHETIRKLESTVESVIQAISLTVEMRDHYTAGHQKRVHQLACAIAREMHLPIERIQVIRVAGLLHDFGKIFVPTEILIKPGKLNELEFSLIRSHPQSGYNVLRNIEFPWPIADIIVQHHERMDGSGYPSHLRGEEIGTEARILAVADVVEAMTFHRSYRPALGLDTALREITSNKSTLYDPQVAEACLDAFLDRSFQWDNV
ncbi:MAG: PAS domain S-box protein [Dehalococcoidia bacterium]|nr:PAS domain S-box protein [Dehalococcoidia bacterium]